MIGIVLCLSFLLKSAARLQRTIGEKNLANEEVCYRWDENKADVLAWKTDGFVKVPFDPDANEHDGFFVQSIARFFGGMTQQTLVNTDQSKGGGFIGASLYNSGPSDCKYRMASTRVLVGESAKITAP